MNRIYTSDLINMINNMKPQYFLHGCNSNATMGAGIAKVLADEWPEVAITDAEYIIPKGIHRLGNASWVMVNDHTNVINLYTQVYPGPDFRPKAFRLALMKFLSMLDIPNWKGDLPLIMMPRIGCGLAKQPHMSYKDRWVAVSKIIREVCEELEITKEQQNELFMIVGINGDHQKYEKSDQD